MTQGKQKRFPKKDNPHWKHNEAMLGFMKVLGNISQLDKRTIFLPSFGVCHFASFRGSGGAIISVTAKGDSDFGAKEWHKHKYILLARDDNDGIFYLYLCETAPLYERRNADVAGATWDIVKNYAIFYSEVLISSLPTPPHQHK